ncbi:MAG: LD-carboxypeptidase [Alphaproteobacteria bacterium]|nr:LD-carboxypeptidase [Alphaproteobacteria bacterium]
MIPEKLKKGDKVMIVAPARGLKLIGQDVREIATQRLNSLGLEVVYAPNTTDENWDYMGSTSVEKRTEDIHTAFKDKSVKAIFTVIGGFNSNQMLKYLDYDLIKQNPKIFCGFSDITAIANAIRAKTGLTTYYGPHFSTLGMKLGCDYTFEHMIKMLIEDGNDNVTPAEIWSDDLWFLDQDKRDFEANEGYWVINDGNAEGRVEGGNLCTYNLLLGTSFRHKFTEDTILFIEDDTTQNALAEFERDLQALIHQEDFKYVKGIVIGRFLKDAKISKEGLEFIIHSKEELKDIPVIANVDFGHTSPILTIPLGGYATIKDKKITLKA